MIRIERGGEPDALAATRRRSLARAVLARRRRVLDHGLPAPEFTGYDAKDVREQLHNVQHAKCVYCERMIGQRGQPTEHFRPKAKADLGDPVADTHDIDVDRYWWLAWTWSNLFLSCSTCNSPTFKGNWFPLEAGSPRLVIPDGVLGDDHVCFAVGIEQGLLIDPAVDDPLEHIQWRPLDSARPLEEWRAFHRTQRGRVTIQVFGLDGRNVDHVGQHVRNAVYDPWVKRVRQALERFGGRAEAAQIWSDALQCLFAPYQPFLAATHDALDFFLPKDERERAGLTPLPRPGVVARVTPAGGVATPAPAIWSELPEDVLLDVIAEELPTGALITTICAVRGSTVAELGDALGLAAATIRRYCDRLVAAGTLVVDVGGGYRRGIAAP